MERNRVCTQETEVLKRQEVNRFLIYVDHEIYLLLKMLLIIGACKACKIKLPSLHMALLITISDANTNRQRMFSVVIEGEAVNPLKLYNKYVRLRSRKVRASTELLTVKHRGG